MRKHIVHIKHGTAIAIAVTALIIILWPLYYELAAPGVKINRPFKIPEKPKFSSTPDFAQLTKANFESNSALTTTEKVEFNSAGDQLAYKAARGWVIAVKQTNADSSKLITELKAAGYPAYAKEGRIIIGPYVEQLQAKAQQERLTRELHLGGEIVSYDPLK